MVRQHLTVIRYHPPSNVHLQSGVYDTDEDMVTRTKNQPEMWVDSEKVHEACHVYLYRIGKKYSGYYGERECMLWQNLYLFHVKAPLHLYVDIEARLRERYWETGSRWW